MRPFCYLNFNGLTVKRITSMPLIGIARLMLGVVSSRQD